MSGTVSASVRAIPAPASDGVSKRRARGRAPGRSLAALLAGTAVALWAQQAVTRGESGETTLLAFAAAAALFIAGVTTGSKDSLLDRSVQVERSAPPAIHRPLL